MEKWGIIIIVALAVFYLVTSIDAVGSAIGIQLASLHEKIDELNEKVDAISAKTDDIEDRLNGKRYVNPIEL
jgi:transcription antitermination factor NusA-like protein